MRDKRSYLLDGISGMAQAPGLLKRTLLLVPLLVLPNGASFLCVYVIKGGGLDPNLGGSLVASLYESLVLVALGWLFPIRTLSTMVLLLRQQLYQRWD